LQNEKKAISVATKIELVERLAQTGLRTIEAGSFVSPKWTPQVGLKLHDIYAALLTVTVDGQFVRNS
jgi:isopropylmalate/homocitrate/citramalate synthase